MKKLMLCALLFAALSSLPAQSVNFFPGYRNFGPWRAGAWISDIAVPETDDSGYRYTFYVAARHGGVWKTENSGTTFRPVFDAYGCNSIGAVEVAASNPAIVWVGTGEASNARSTHAGNGIWKSGDGGETFVLSGLKDSHHIPRIVIHPHDPGIVYAAVMGHLFSRNDERGVFRTRDGGLTWEKVLFLSDSVGVIDLTMNRNNPDILYAAAYDKKRLPWHYEAGGPESGIYRTADGGDTWSRLSGGLPSGNIGRIGLDLFRGDPDILYAVIENLNPRPLTPEEEKERAEAAFDPMKDPWFDYLVGGEVYRSEDGGVTWSKRNAPGDNVSSKAAYSFNQIGVDPDNADNLFINSVAMYTSHDGGRTWHDLTWPPRHRFTAMFGDIRTFWIDPGDPRHMLIGSDGGLYASWDAGKTTDHYYNLPLGEVYMVTTDDAFPYHIYAGLQDHETWRAPVNSWSGQVGLEDWCITGLWDGMYTAVDHETGRYVYFTSQFGAQHRMDQKTGTRAAIQPQPAAGEPPVRHCWTTPIVLSPHNAAIVYTGGQYLYRSLDRGDHWQKISGDLTTNDPVKIAGRGHMMYCTITTISESPLVPGVIWTGTDDGRVWLTRDHGASWTEFSAALAGLGAPADRWVVRVVASSHAPGRAFAVKTGFRHDDFSPYLFVTDDYGEHWRRITAGLPQAPVNVVAEGVISSRLLFAGTDAGIYVSYDQGEQWRPFSGNMPPVPVKDLTIQSRELDLVAASYGRGVWIADIWPLEHLPENPEGVILLPVEPKPVRTASEQAGWGNYELTGDRHAVTPNEPGGLTIYYLVGEKGVKARDSRLEILSGSGQEAARFDDPDLSPGLHAVRWEARGASPGEYTVRMVAGKTTAETRGVLLEAPVWPVGNQRR
ncbi:hypothetical protein JXO52_10640 [bacterium]|nr:hypothetical protein [bacterium]